MRRPRLLDLCCGAGGCSVGFHRAGFDVTGCDKLPHPEYPFPMIVGDAMSVLACPAVLDSFDVVAISPPCPLWSTITPEHTRDSHPDLITPARELLQAWGGIYVIENVEGARKVLRDPIKLCGSAFGLEVRRHRYFETNAPGQILQPGCRHAEQGRPIGVYGDHPQDDSDYRRPDGTRRGHKAHDIPHAQRAMGIDWITNWDDLADAIPPSYTEFIGAHLMTALERAA